MIANNSYLLMGGVFLLLGIYSHQNSDMITALIFIWSAIVFSFFWLLYFSKVNYSKDLTSYILRDSFLKQCIFGIIFLPFYLLKYLSLVLQSFSGEKPMAQVTGQIFIGQQLLWFHGKAFTDKEIGSVLDVTVENREPYFIARDKSIRYLKLSVLDKASPSEQQLDMGVRWCLEQISQGMNLYVHCGAGHERSATFVAAVLIKAGYCKTVAEAIEKIKYVRPKVKLLGEQQKMLEQWLKG